MSTILASGAQMAVSEPRPWRQPTLQLHDQLDIVCRLALVLLRQRSLQQQVGEQKKSVLFRHVLLRMVGQLTGTQNGPVRLDEIFDGRHQRVVNFDHFDKTILLRFARVDLRSNLLDALDRFLDVGGIEVVVGNLGRKVFQQQAV